MKEASLLSSLWLDSWRFEGAFENKQERREKEEEEKKREPKNKATLEGSINNKILIPPDSFLLCSFN